MAAPACPISDVDWDTPPAGLLPTVIISCSGGSDVGSITDRATRALVKSGVGKLVCLAALACRDEAALASLRAASRVMVFDGCQGRCVERLLETLDIKNPLRINLADLGLVRDDTVVDDATIVSIAAQAERILLQSCRAEATPPTTL